MKKSLTTLVAGLMLTATSVAAKADYIFHFSVKEKDGKTYEEYATYTDKDVWKGTEIYDQSGKYVGHKGPKSDPNPDDSAKGTDKPNPEEELKKAIREAALKGGGELKLTPSFWASPLGQHLIDQGRGIIPKYQPGDDDNNNIGAKPTKVPKLNDGKMIEETTQKPGPMTTPGYQPNSGSFADYVMGVIKGGAPPKNPQGDTGPAPKDHDTGNPHDKDALGGRGIFSEDMPGPPPLVNPIPLKTTFTCARAEKTCVLTFTTRQTLTLNLPDMPADDRASNARPRQLKSTSTQKSASCGPNMTPNASGKGCVPKLDVPGSDFSAGSTASSGRSVPAAAGGTMPAGRR
jgi:hypothetical protein